MKIMPMTMDEVRYWQQIPAVREMPPASIVEFTPDELFRRMRMFTHPEDRAYGWWQREGALIFTMSEPYREEHLTWYVPFPAPILWITAFGMLLEWMDDDKHWPAAPAGVEDEDYKRAFNMVSSFTPGEGDIWDRGERSFLMIRTMWMDKDGVLVGEV